MNIRREKAKSTVIDVLDPLRHKVKQSQYCLCKLYGLLH